MSARKPTPNVLADGDTDIMAAVLDGATVARETPNDANAITSS